MPFGYEHTGRLDHLAAYRPLTGILYASGTNPTTTPTTRMRELVRHRYTP